MVRAFPITLMSKQTKRSAHSTEVNGTLHKCSSSIAVWKLSYCTYFSLYTKATGRTQCNFKVLDPFLVPVLVGDSRQTKKKKYFFTQCMVKLWNSLQQELAIVADLGGFKVD